MVDREMVRREFAEKSVEELVYIVRVVPEQYTPAAVDVAIELLTARGVSVERKPPESPAAKRERARVLSEGNDKRITTGLIILGVGLSTLFFEVDLIWIGGVLWGGLMVANGLSRMDDAKQLEAEADQADAATPPPEPSRGNKDP